MFHRSLVVLNEASTAGNRMHDVIRLMAALLTEVCGELHPSAHTETATNLSPAAPAARSRALISSE